ncbi:MAG: Uroporphyrinogen-III methyltransferase / Uroporphyrinogen-III synthase, partial [uncultured Friedmanniella sp.]
GARPDQPGVPAPRRHRHRDPHRRADRAGLGGRGRDGLPDRPRHPAAGPGPRGDQDRPVRRRRLHLLLHRPQPGGHRRQAARLDRHRGHRPGHGEDLRGARAPGRRRRHEAVGGRPGRRAGRLRGRAARRLPGRGRARPQAVAEAHVTPPAGV